MIIKPAGNRRGTEFGLSPPNEGASSKGKRLHLFRCDDHPELDAEFLVSRPAFPFRRSMPKPRNHWMVKQEPAAYSWDDFVADGGTAWTGVRNFQARNHLRSMRKGDLVLFYHSVVGKEVMGIARVSRDAYPDPTATEDGWDCVDLTPVRALKRPVPLTEIKSHPKLKTIGLVRQSRLSVIPLQAVEYTAILKIAEPV